MSAADDAAEAAKLDAELEAAVVDASGAAGEDDGEVSPAKVLRFPLFCFRPVADAAAARETCRLGHIVLAECLVVKGSAV